MKDPFGINLDKKVLVFHSDYKVWKNYVLYVACKLMCGKFKPFFSILRIGSCMYIHVNILAILSHEDTLNGLIGLTHLHKLGVLALHYCTPG